MCIKKNLEKFLKLLKRLVFNMNNSIENIKKSIYSHYQNSEKEKSELLSSIEMYWLNADIQRKKTEITIPNTAKENIIRIRQLLAAAWAEDYKK